MENKILNIVVLWLYDPKDEKFLTGGMERWCRDAARLARDHGYQVRIWQKSPDPFKKAIEEGIEIWGIRCPMGFRGNWSLAKALEKQSLNVEEPFLFVSQEILGFGRFPRAVAVNHGIWWDGDFPFWKKAANKRLQRKLIMQAQATICVDTNYINWCHAEIPNRGKWRSRLFYVPNYADEKNFKKVGDEKVDIRSPTILFPRRVSGANLAEHGRGAGLLIQAVAILEARGIFPRVIFAGRGNLQAKILDWANSRKMEARVEVREASFEEMPELYAKADVVVVPSIEHEGTSLAAVEGIVSGKRVIVSHIGGLGNIVIDGLNGFVCDLTPESLANSICEALNTPTLHKSPDFLKRCRIALGKDCWDKKIWSIIQFNLGL